MEPIEAVQTAKDFVRRVFADEQISRPRLEELTHDPDTGEWRVTIGFAFEVSPHPVDAPALSPLARKVYGNRMYKVVHIQNETSEVSGMTDRLLDPVA